MSENDNTNNDAAASEDEEKLRRLSTEKRLDGGLPNLAQSYSSGDSENSDPPWIVSFIDTLSLLLTFFVLLFSMSTIDTNVWQDVVDTFDSTFKEAEGIGGPGQPLDQAVPKILRQKAINLDYLGRIIRTQLERTQQQDIATIQRLDDRLVISLPSDLIFAPARATLKPGSQRPLVVIGSILRNVRNAIEIHGHTDPDPLRGGVFTSNWELSLARAEALRDQLKRLGLRRDPRILGFADGSYEYLSETIPRQRKYALARRVDIVIYPYAP